jgi:hypothetical protein
MWAQNRAASSGEAWPFRARWKIVSASRGLRQAVYGQVDAGVGGRGAQRLERKRAALFQGSQVGNDNHPRRLPLAALRSCTFFKTSLGATC